MVDEKLGGTPIYASPECFTGTVVGKSDLFSLGRLFLYLSTTTMELFYSLLFVAIKKKTSKKSVDFILAKYPILAMILRMTRADVESRPEVLSIEEELKKIVPFKSIDFTELKSQGLPINMNQDCINDMLSHRYLFLH